MEIDKLIEEVFDVDYMSEKFSEPEYREKYIDKTNNIIATYGWNDTYLSIYKYLLNKVKNKDDVVNFSNLYSFYGLCSRNIPNPIEFCSILVNSFNICDCWNRGGEVINETVSEILITSCLLDEDDLDEYRVYDDPRF